MSTEIHALAGAYVLDAVDDLERRSFERHLDECPSCLQEVAELRETTARLADATWSVPSPRMRESVLTAVARTRQVGPEVSPPAERDPVVRRWRRFTAGAAAACILATGAAAATWAVQEQRVRDERATAAAARAEAARIRTILAAPDLVMRSSQVTGGGKVTMAMSPTHNAGVVMVAAAAPPAADRSFQLWFLDEGQPVNAGVMPPGAAEATMVFEGVSAHDGLGVTVEPANGSLKPTMPTVAAINLT